MIMVDLEIPTLGERYQVKLDEQIPVKMLIAELTEVFSQKEQNHWQGKIEELQLCSKELKCILSQTTSLEKQGVINTSSLILI